MLRKRKANRDMEREIKKIFGKTLVLFEDDRVDKCALKVASAHNVPVNMVIKEYRRHGYVLNSAYKIVAKKKLSIVAAARKFDVRACRLSALVAERAAQAIKNAESKARFEARKKKFEKKKAKEQLLTAGE